MRFISSVLLLLVSISVVACGAAKRIGGQVITPPPPPDIPGLPKPPMPPSIPDAPKTLDQPDIPQHIELSISHQAKHNQPFPDKIGEIPESKATHLPPDTAIESWSLFLMPDYPVPYRMPEFVQGLKKAWENLGGAIGGVNSSEWLVTGAAEKVDHPESNYDYKRAQKMSRQLDMDSATGPYIVITLASPNHLSPDSPAFVARLTGINYKCYPQVVDSLTRYIKKKKYSSWKKVHDSWEDIKIEVLRSVTCIDASMEMPTAGN